MKERGKWFWKEQWYSICSRAHNEDMYDKDCPLCQVGNWHNVWLNKIEGFFHDHCYKLWYWWINRKPIKFEKYDSSTDSK